MTGALLRGFLSFVPALAVAGTAFLCLAGYSYLDSLRSGFGIGFAATETSTVEVMSLGFNVVLAALFDALPAYVWHSIPLVLVGAALAITIGVGVKRGGRGVSWASRAIDVSLDGAGPHYIVSACIIGVALLAASPAGTFAAKQQKAWILGRVKAGCCYDYQPKDGPAIRGVPLAEDHNRVWVVNLDGVTAVPLEGAKIALRPEFVQRVKATPVDPLLKNR
ncbi:hypothetical protein [Sphingomonas sp. BK069]|uniref:hypothetical protein n=1 Tax=Sphingomonas sp. BK069 TaxID=2586979 RepID=UPI001610A12C|nr:hypothetical protein [Sphingomonas sp. BK069]MBB3349435.1 hypothetical protein [Sphingomonas sp. BK069]